jgi:hypothetical protein
MKMNVELASPSSTTLAIVVPNLVALASVAVAAVAIYVNRRMTQDTLRHQLDLTHNERIWQQRSETYLELLVWMDEWDDKSRNITSDFSSMDLSGEQAESDRRTQAKVDAFASSKIVELVKLWRQGMASFALVLHDLLAAKAAIDQLDLDPDSVRLRYLEEAEKFSKALEPVSGSLEAVRASIHDQIRSELQSK